MFDLFERLKMHMTVSAVLTLVFGLLLAVMPGMAVGTLLGLLGWLLLVMGILWAISAGVAKNVPGRSGGLVLGLLLAATGLVILLRPDFLVSVVGVILGVLLLIHGAMDLQNARTRRAMGYDWTFYLVVGILTLAMGVLVLLNPFSTVTVLMRVAGICLIVDAVGTIGALLWCR